MKYAVKHGKYLDVFHKIQVRVKDLKMEGDLRGHMILMHGISTKNMNKGDMAKYHLLAHALEAFPEIEELLDN